MTTNIEDGDLQSLIDSIGSDYSADDLLRLSGNEIHGAGMVNSGVVVDTVSDSIGYSIGDRGLHGNALLTSRNIGVELIFRLKDTRPLLISEIVFWGRMLARLSPEGIDLVTHAPSSGKRPDSEHLATLLAKACAHQLKKPFASVFVNEHPRGNRGCRSAKLIEMRENLYRYIGPGNGSLILVVDDVVFTRSTAKRCLQSATQAGDRCVFSVLYRA